MKLFTLVLVACNLYFWSSSSDCSGCKTIDKRAEVHSLAAELADCEHSADVSPVNKLVSLEICFCSIFTGELIGLDIPLKNKKVF